MLTGSAELAEKKYRKAIAKGIVKVISKMGISTIQSYHGAQVFEAVGLNQDFVDEYFTGTPTRIGGIGIDVVAREVKMRQDRAYPPKRPDLPQAARRRRPRPVPRGRRAPPVQPAVDRPAPVRHAERQLHGLQGVLEAHRRPVRRAVHAARPDGLQAEPPPPARHRRGRAGRGDRAPLQDRGDELRLHLAAKPTKRWPSP